ncbi:MAG: 4Fe-4S dicluster domain-containing protein [Euryarchaeota archaeon]|nr:4Fe-4S dicluster domain-containing protein [Euryarchaeota archaeon]
MPRHIVSGLKYIAAVNLRKKGHTQKKIAEILDMDRSTVSHYLNGRNVSWTSIEIAEVITNFCPKDFMILTYALLKDREQTRNIIKTCSARRYEAFIKDSCIGCALCVDNCLMNAITLDNLRSHIDPEWCFGCRICETECPTDSIEIKEVD